MTFNEQVQEVAKVMELDFLSLGQIKARVIYGNNIPMTGAAVKFTLETLVKDGFVIKESRPIDGTRRMYYYKINKNCLTK